MDKDDVEHTYNGILIPAIERNKIELFVET